jgi:hypothetical protein
MQKGHAEKDGYWEEKYRIRVLATPPQVQALFSMGSNS